MGLIVSNMIGLIVSDMMGLIVSNLIPVGLISNVIFLVSNMIVQQY